MMETTPQVIIVDVTIFQWRHLRVIGSKINDNPTVCSELVHPIRQNQSSALLAPCEGWLVYSYHKDAVNSEMVSMSWRYIGRRQCDPRIYFLLDAIRMIMDKGNGSSTQAWSALIISLSHGLAQKQARGGMKGSCDRVYDLRSLAVKGSSLRAVDTFLMGIPMIFHRFLGSRC